MYPEAAYLKGLSKDGPCPPSLCVCMAYGVYIRTTLVHGTVDVVAGFVGSDFAGSGIRVSPNDASCVDLQRDHVAGRQSAIVAGERIHPHDLGKLRVADGDVP